MVYLFFKIGKHIFYKKELNFEINFGIIFQFNTSAEFQILCSFMPLLWQDAYVDLEFLNDVGLWAWLCYDKNELCGCNT